MGNCIAKCKPGQIIDDADIQSCALDGPTQQLESASEPECHPTCRKQGDEKCQTSVRMASCSYSTRRIKGNFASVGADSAMSIPPAESGYFVLRKTDDVESKYMILEELGRGQFGVVSSAIDRQTGTKHAIKSISKRRAEECEYIRTEVEVLYLLAGHPNIVQLQEVYEDRDTIHLVMELCEGGNWCQRLIAQGTYSERKAAEAIHTLLKTLAYCHSLGVVHRDIKPEQVLYTDYTENAKIKLADFGLAAMVPKTALQAPDSKIFASRALSSGEAVGSTYYVAPEVLMFKGNGKESDVWSLGVTLYITLGGYPPFDGATEAQMFNAIKYEQLRFSDATWNEISDLAKDFISRMLCKDPRSRASIPELLAHPWLSVCGVTRASRPAKTARAVDVPLPDVVISRLNNFASLNRFKKEARKVLAMMLPEEEVIGMMQIFKEMDKDNDGVLTLSELYNGLASKGVDLRDAEALFKRSDMNRNGVIDYEEFLAATVHQIRLDKDDLMFKAFQHFDTTHSGYITMQELKEALSHGPPMDFDALLKDMDMDADGRINYEEFCKAVRHQDHTANEHFLNPSSRHLGQRSLKTSYSAWLATASRNYQKIRQSEPGNARVRFDPYAAVAVPTPDVRNGQAPEQILNRFDGAFGSAITGLEILAEVREEQEQNGAGDLSKSGGGSSESVADQQYADGVPVARGGDRAHNPKLKDDGERAVHRSFLPSLKPRKELGKREVCSRRPSLRNRSAAADVGSLVTARKPSLRWRNDLADEEVCSRRPSLRRREELIGDRAAAGRSTSVRWREDVAEEAAAGQKQSMRTQEIMGHLAAESNVAGQMSFSKPNLQAGSTGRAKPDTIAGADMYPISMNAATAAAESVWGVMRASSGLTTGSALPYSQAQLPNSIITPRPSIVGDNIVRYHALTDSGHGHRVPSRTSSASSLHSCNRSIRRHSSTNSLCSHKATSRASSSCSRLLLSRMPSQDVSSSLAPVSQPVLGTPKEAACQASWL